MRKISEAVRIDTAFAPVDVATNDQTGAWVEMADYRRVLAYATTAAVANGKHVTLQLLQARDANGTGSKALSDVVTVTSTGGAVTASVEAQASDLDLANGYGFVTAQVTCDDGSAVVGTAILIRGDARFGTGNS
ncbi:MAG: hypothetical protein K6T78_08005 [Alicyclobacillus sp.]|nr:hypothetical protein [Alicyclobacillus sp.]